MITDIIAKSIDVLLMTYIDEYGIEQPILASSAILVGKKDERGDDPIQGGEHERYVTDKNNLISRQVSGGGNVVIPLPPEEGVGTLKVDKGVIYWDMEKSPR